MTHDYNVKLETFEGPLPLLLDLVEKRKLFINEISLAMIADDYIAHLKSF
jgi:segregation and condensation protein A